jgi:hypothetical protein
MGKICSVKALHGYFAGPTFLDGLRNFLRRKRPMKSQNNPGDA